MGLPTKHWGCYLLKQSPRYQHHSYTNEGETFIRLKDQHQNWAFVSCTKSTTTKSLPLKIFSFLSFHNTQSMVCQIIQNLVCAFLSVVAAKTQPKRMERLWGIMISIPIQHKILCQTRNSTSQRRNEWE